jgi:hypothetical protein
MDRSAWRILLVPIAILGIAACAKTPPPVDRLEAARQSIVEAERGGAHEDAPLELYVARERLEQAKEAMTKKEYVAARRYADDAVVNAELGRVKAQGARNKREADELKAEVDELADEINRKLSPSIN